MTNTIFCLSMPGGHMTYLGVLTKLLLGHLSITNEYITKNGSAHNADAHFPTQLYEQQNWENWLKYAHKTYSINDVCIIKDGWGCTSLDIWQHNINLSNQIQCVISSPITKLDWIYSWLSYSQKMPAHLYGHLKTKNILFPIWHMLSNKHKLKSFNKSMPIFPINENLTLNCPVYRFPTTKILDENFPNFLHEFLQANNLKSKVTDDLLYFHNYFVTNQKTNYNMALELINNKRWKSRNMFDTILFNWLDTNPWEGLE